MNLPTENQTAAALRHVYTAAATVLGLAAVVAVVPKEQVQPILDSLHQIGDGVQQVIGGFSKLMVIVGPIVGVWMARLAAGSASFKSQLASVAKQASAPGNPENAKQMVEATAELPVVAKVVAPAIAPEVASDKVVAH